MDSFYIIDAYNYIYRAHYAIRDMVFDGKPRGAIYGFITSIEKILGNLPDYLVIAFEGKNSIEKRCKIYSKYKASREKPEDSLLEQIELAKIYCQARGLATLSIDGFESDDMIGSVATWASKLNLDIYICSGDKDFSQLVKENVHILKDKKIGRDDIKKQFGIWPEQFVDYMALMGDSSDEIPGVFGIGKVKARKLLNQYGSLDNILQSDIEGSIGKSLRDGYELALTSKELATIVCDLPIDKNLNNYKISNINVEKIRELLNEIGSNALLKKWSKPTEISREEIPQGEKTIMIEDSLTITTKEGSFAIDLEKARSLDLGECSGYDIKSLLQRAAAYDIKFKGIFDIAIAAHLCNIEGSMEEISKRLGKDSFGIKTFLERSLKEKLLTRYFLDIEMPLMEILYEVESTGVLIDRFTLEKKSKEEQSEISKIEKQVHKLANKSFNIRSPKILSEVLLSLGIPLKKTSSGGYSTREEILTSLIDSHPIVAKVLEYRHTDISLRLMNGILEKIDDDGRVRTRFNQFMTSTGRLSSTNPNLQNIPHNIRKAFIPSHEDWKILSCDYSQIELRLLAHMSEDPLLIDAFDKGEDIHKATASEIFNLPIDKISNEMRSKAKMVNYSMLYGQTPYGLANSLKISALEASNLLKNFFKRYPKVDEYVKRVEKEALTSRRSTTLMGRTRILKGNKSQIKRLAINTPMQGSQAEIVKIATIEVWKWMKKEGLLATLILHLHDELIYELPKEEVPIVSSKVKNIMENVVKLKVALQADIYLGENWGSMVD